MNAKNPINEHGLSQSHERRSALPAAAIVVVGAGVLAACSPAKRSEGVPFQGHPSVARTLGDGVHIDKMTQPMPSCFDFEMKPGPGGALETEISLYSVNSISDRLKTFGVDLTVEAGFLLGSLQGSYSNRIETAYHSSRSHFVLDARAKYPDLFVSQLKLKPEVKEVLDREGPNRIIQECGTHYVARAKREHHVLIEFSVDSAAEHTTQENRWGFRAKAGFGPLSASAETQARQAITEGLQSGKTSLKIFAVGGEGIRSFAHLAGRSVGDFKSWDAIQEGVTRALESFHESNAAVVGGDLMPVPSWMFGNPKTLWREEKRGPITEMLEQYLHMAEVKSAVEEWSAGTSVTDRAWNQEAKRHVIKQLDGMMKELQSRQVRCRFAETDEEVKKACVVDELTLPVFAEEIYARAKKGGA